VGGEDEFLKRVTLFADLSDAQRARIMAGASVVHVPAGGWLFEAGDPGDALYLVRHGRLEVVRDGVVIRVLGAGSAVGELALLTAGERSASVRARRESEVLKVEREHFAELLAGDPAFAIALTRTLGEQLQRTAVVAAPASAAARVITVVALQPSMADVAARIARTLVADLPGAALLVGDEAEPAEHGRLLDRCESTSPFVVLLALGDGDGLWREFCLRQADRVVGVIDPAMGMGAAGAAAPDRESAPVTDLAVVSRVLRGAALGPWLDVLRPMSQHHIDPTGGFDGDVARMSRRLSGRAVGLVLSGGGARGLAHIGVIAALHDAGVSIDRFGGTSMGSFVAGLGALGLSPSEMTAVAREELAARNPFNDYNLPRHSLIKARKAEAMLLRVFGHRRVEELTRPFFAVSADLLSGEEVIHARGPVAVAVGISMCLPGLVPPVSTGDRLLVDGGVLNNLPVDVMADTGEGPVVAVDVMRRPAPKGDKPLRVRPRRTKPSPFGLFSPDDDLPSLVDTLARSTVLGSWRRAEANRARAAVVISPELVDVGLLEFRRIDSIIDRGRAAAEAALAAGISGLSEGP
jgi:NTE family protein